MKRHKHQTQKTNYILIASIAVIVIIAAILLFSGNKDNAVEDLDIEQDAQQAQPVLEEELAEEIKPIEVIKEEVTPVLTKKVGEEGLCEDYFFEQGDELKIVGHSIIVEKIANSALRLNADGESLVVSEGDTETIGDGIEVSVAPGKILYFGQDDPSNSAMLRVGCDYDDNVNDKYVQSRGERICQEVYEDCQNSFNIDLSE